MLSKIHSSVSTVPLIKLCLKSVWQHSWSDPTREADIKQVRSSMAVHVAQKQETERKQEVCKGIAKTEPEVVSRRSRSGLCEMLTNNLCRAHRFPLCETINTVIPHHLTPSCRFINSQTRHTWTSWLTKNCSQVTQLLEKLHGKHVKKCDLSFRGNMLEP